METRLLPRATRPMEGNPKGKWTSLIHLLNEGFLEVCFQGLKRDVATGVDGVYHLTYTLSTVSREHYRRAVYGKTVSTVP